MKEINELSKSELLELKESINDQLTIIEKEENQSIITVDGKEYEFIEYSDNRCNHCDLYKNADVDCSYPCLPGYKTGYFKQKKSKDLELIPNEFYYKNDNDIVNTQFVMQYKSINTDLNCSCNYFYLLNITTEHLYMNNWCLSDKYVLATPEQKQMLIDKVKEEKGLIYNESTKTFDQPCKILVPENIKIIKYYNDQLGLLFNSKQVLVFDKKSKTYLVLSLDMLDTFVNCELILCEYKELEVGDLFFAGIIEIENADSTLYGVKLNDNQFVTTGNVVSIYVNDLSTSSAINYYYKVVQINN